MNTVEKIESFFGKYTIIKYRPGERILRPGENFQDILYIKNGIAQMCSESKSGGDIIIAFLNASQYKGLVFGSSQENIQYYTQAVTAVDVVRAPREDFLEFYKRNPDVGLLMVSNYGKIILNLSTQVKILKNGNAYIKIASYIRHLVQIFGTPTKEGSIVIAQKFTHQKLADYTGLTRETVSTHLSRLEKEHIIITEEHMFTVLDTYRLNEITEENV